MATLAQATLENHGIPCSVDGDQLARSLSYYGIAVVRVNLMVHAEVAEEARQILDQFDADLHPQGEGPWGMNGMGWVCEGCAEVNARSFDECWSCQLRRPSDPEFVPLDDEADSVDVEERPGMEAAPLQEDDSPYRPPRYAHAVVKVRPDSELARRAVRSAILSCFFPPLVLYSMYVVWKCMSAQNVPAKIYAAFALNIVTLVIAIALFISTR